MLACFCRIDLLPQTLPCQEASMPQNHRNEVAVRCSFCDKSADEVRQIIAGPNVHICNECVEVCVSYLTPQSKLSALGMLLSPWKWNGRSIKVPPSHAPPAR